MFDKDKHSNYQQALNCIENIKPKKVFFAATSDPCFEYWLLLHYTYSTKPYEKTEKKSIGGNILEDLKQYITGYEKGKRDIFSLLKDQLKFAIENAKRANQEAKTVNGPSTTVFELVEYLVTLKKE